VAVRAGFELATLVVIDTDSIGSCKSDYFTITTATALSWTWCGDLVCIIRVITKLPNSEQSYKGKVKIHKYINRKNQSTTRKLWKP